MTADRLGLLACHTCGLLSRRPERPIRCHCPRCRAPLHRRRPHSLRRTRSLLIAATLLYLPANTLPVMSVTSLGRNQADTILSGVVHLFQGGLWPLALLVFFASILVPVLKLAVLAYLVHSIQRGSRRHLRDRARLYRLVETVGRWSMVDIFVVTLLAALVQLGELATITAGPGASAFGAVVVLTMLAAHTFDPRLIWDERDVR